MNKEGEESTVKLDNEKSDGKIITFFKNLFKDTKEKSLLDINLWEKYFDSAKKYFFSNFDKEKNELTWKNIKDKIKSGFTDFKIDVSAGGSCNENSCNLMVNFCFNLFDLTLDDKFIFPFKLLPYIECAFSIIPTIKSEICVGIGPNFDLHDSDKNSFDIDISGGATVGVTVDFGVYVPSINNPIRLSLNIGLIGILGSGRSGVKLSLYYKDKFGIDLYYEFKAFELSFYVMFTLTFQIKALVEINFSFSFYIFQKLFGSFKYEYHKERIYKYAKSKFLEEKISKTKNGGKWRSGKR